MWGGSDSILCPRGTAAVIVELLPLVLLLWILLLQVDVLQQTRAEGPLPGWPGPRGATGLTPGGQSRPHWEKRCPSVLSFPGERGQMAAPRRCGDGGQRRMGRMVSLQSPSRPQILGLCALEHDNRLIEFYSVYKVIKFLCS